MSVVIELSDRALALARDGVAIEVLPSVVRAAAARGGQPGASMLGRERIAPTEVSTDHWAALARAPDNSPAALQTAAAELLERVKRAGLPTQCPAELVTAAPFDGRNLGVVLALTASAGLRVLGCRDAAVVAAAAVDAGADTLVAELGLHHVAVTRVSRAPSGWARSGQALSTRHGGWIELQQRWLALAAEAFVLRTRFDPLHDARTEQQLYDALPAALAQAAASGNALLRVQGPGGTTLTAELTRDQLAMPAQALTRSLLNLLHSLRPAGSALTLLMPGVLAQLPGIETLLTEFQGCELVSMPDGFAAASLSAALSRGLLPSATPRDDGAVRLLRRIEQRIAPAADPSTLQRRRLGAVAAANAPTHLLYAGRALPITTRPLEIGRGPAAESTLSLPDGMAGVSRLHCSVQREGAQVVVVDHSRYGSFLNGERIAGRALLRAGDTLRVGDPGIEFSMIAVGDSHAPPPPN